MLVNWVLGQANFIKMGFSFCKIIIVWTLIFEYTVIGFKIVQISVLLKIYFKMQYCTIL